MNVSNPITIPAWGYHKTIYTTAVYLERYVLSALESRINHIDILTAVHHPVWNHPVSGARYESGGLDGDLVLFHRYTSAGYLSQDVIVLEYNG